jgi:hypothetical protein
MHSITQELTVDGIKGLSKIQESQDCPGFIRTQSSREQLQEVDVVTNQALGEEGRLFRPHGLPHHVPHTSTEHTSQEAIISVEQSDGAVVGGHRCIPRLRDRAHQASSKGMGHGLLGPDGSEQASQQVHQAALA